MKKFLMTAALLTAVAFSVPSLGATSECRFGKTTVLGDSIASGYGLPDYVSGDNYSAPLSFGNLIADECGGYENFAVDGRTSSELLEALTHPAGALGDSITEADRIVISIGGNDFLKPMIAAVKTAALTDSDMLGSIINGEFKPEMISGYTNRILQAALSAGEKVDVDKTVENIAKIVEIIKRANPGAEIVLLTVYDPFAGSVLLKSASDVAEERLAVLNNGIKKLAGGNVKIADVYAAFKGNEAEFTNIAKLDIHPSAEGHYAIYKLLSEV
ncbi:MAG: SGNH/GDSL hydrolase family protein [Oscillospiraceae bacterium]|nr:SGNH/GDSL hydrolase family protein [Oscillospiraceae bacterium]